jgi:hypothetical protein
LPLFGAELEGEVGRKAMKVASDRLIEGSRLHTIENGEIAIEHDRLTAHLENAKLFNDRNGIFVGVHG